MRCFFNFKPKKSSSDNQQLIQLEEIKRDIKQQIMQDLEAKPMATNKVAVEGIVETRVEKKKEKDNFWTLLSKWNRLLAALSSISIIIAAMSVYSYLADIESRYLLADIISQPSVFLSIVILFAVLMLCILIPVYIPFVIAGYITGELLKEGNTNAAIITEARKKAYKLFSSSSLLINPTIICLLIYCKQYIPSPVILLFIFILITLEIFFIGYEAIVNQPNFNTRQQAANSTNSTERHSNSVAKSNNLVNYIKGLKNINWFSWITLGTVFLAINIIFLLSITFVLDISANWFYGFTYYLYLVLFVVFVIIGCLLASSLVGFGRLADKKEDENKVKKLMWLTPLPIVIFFSWLSFMQEGSKFKQHLFQSLGYIEMPSQARWYLLDKRYLEWNDINKNKNDALGPLKTNSLPLWRNKFKPLPKLNVYSPNLHNNFYSYDYRYSNAFFGYMVWNLGEIKIFCPQSVTLDKNVANNCLYIKSDYLQPIPEGV